MSPSARCCAAVNLMAAVLLAATAPAQSTGKGPADYANPLVGTAPLDRRQLIGNAPPPGEQLYSGFTSPGATLPHSSTEMAPINANLPLQYVAGVPATYYYPNRSIFGFAYGDYGGGGGPTIMPVVGDWALPPQRTPSVYDKKREVASPGYYSVFLDDFHVEAEMTATTWTGLYRFTFPAADQAYILVDTDRTGGSIEIVGNTMLRGQVAQEKGRRGQGADDAYFVAEFSRPFEAFGAFKERPPTQYPTQFSDPGSLLGDKEVAPGSRTISGLYAGGYLQFGTHAGDQILVKIARGSSY